jgi:hypothetical protein
VTIRSSTDVHLPTQTQPLDSPATQRTQGSGPVQRTSLPTDGVELQARRDPAIATSLAPPRVPDVKLDTATTSGALSFGQQLKDMGAPAGTSDDLLARFLKLAIISGTLDKVSEYLAGEGSSILMQGALSNAREALYNEAESLRSQADSKDQQAQAMAEQAQASNKNEDGSQKGGLENDPTILEAVKLHEEADAMRERAGEMEHSYMTGIGVSGSVRMGARDEDLNKRAADSQQSASSLVNALSNSSRKLEVFAEAEQSRAEVARLVLEMVEKRNDAHREALRYR